MGDFANAADYDLPSILALSRREKGRKKEQDSRSDNSCLLFGCALGLIFLQSKVVTLYQARTLFEGWELEGWELKYVER